MLNLRNTEKNKNIFFKFNPIKMQLSASPIVLAWSQALIPVYICVKSRFTVFGSVFWSVFACLGNISWMGVGWSIPPQKVRYGLVG